MAGGKDLRSERLTDRKHELRRLLSKVPESRMQYVEHIEQHGKALFDKVCKMDLEGMVAKYSHGPYITEAQQTTWFKIKNRNYSQMEGREKLFERERHQEPAPGWHGCDLACAEIGARICRLKINLGIAQLSTQPGRIKACLAESLLSPGALTADRQYARIASLNCGSQSFCVQSYDYHSTHRCSRKPVEGDQRTQDRTKAA
jgi:hypothetical protein